MQWGHLSNLLGTRTLAGLNPLQQIKPSHCRWLGADVETEFGTLHDVDTLRSTILERWAPIIVECQSLSRPPGHEILGSATLVIQAVHGKSALRDIVSMTRTAEVVQGTSNGVRSSVEGCCAAFGAVCACGQQVARCWYTWAAGAASVPGAAGW